MHTKYILGSFVLTLSHDELAVLQTALSNYASRTRAVVPFTDVPTDKQHLAVQADIAQAMLVSSYNPEYATPKYNT